MYIYYSPLDLARDGGTGNLLFSFHISLSTKNANMFLLNPVGWPFGAQQAALSERMYEGRFGVKVQKYLHSKNFTPNTTDPRSRRQSDRKRKWQATEVKTTRNMSMF